MQKIQQLLEKHKNNIAKWYDNIEFRELSEWNFRLYLRNEPWDIDYISFCEILFNTPFLSLLEWKEPLQAATLKCQIKSSLDIKCYNVSDSNFHKLYLALLESDKERVEYIEANTI